MNDYGQYVEGSTPNDAWIAIRKQRPNIKYFTMLPVPNNGQDAGKWGTMEGMRVRQTLTYYINKTRNPNFFTYNEGLEHLLGELTEALGTGQLASMADYFNDPEHVIVLLPAGYDFTRTTGFVVIGTE